MTFRTDTFVDTAEPPIAHDRAYWVSEIRGRENPGFVDVDLTTHGCGGDVPFTEPVFGQGVDPLPWVSEGARVSGAEPVAAGNRLSGTLANVASLTIDLDTACLDATPDLSGLTTDGPVTLTFTSGGSPSSEAVIP